MLASPFRRATGKRLISSRSTLANTPRPQAGQSRFAFAEALERRTLLTVTPDPGNTYATAYEVGQLAGAQTFQDAVGPSDSADIYRFEMPMAGHFYGRLRVYNANAEVDLLQQYTDSTGHTVITLVTFRDAIAGGTDADFASGDFDMVLAAGTYFLEAASLGNDTQYLARLTADYAGSTLGTARDIGTAVNESYADFVGQFGTPSLNDPTDIYKVKLDALAQVQFILTQDNGYTDNSTFRTHLEVITDLNHNGNIDNGEIEITTPSDSAGIINYTLGAGIYYLRVVSDLNYANYHLQVYADYAGTTESTARNLGQLSANITVNDFVSSAADFRDTYKFSLAAQRPFFAFMIAGSTIDVLLYRDNNNNGIIDNGEFIDSTVNQGSNKLLDNLSAGNYFIRVDAYSGGAGKYSLSLQAPPDGAGGTLGTAKNLGTVNGLYLGSALDTFISNTDTADIYKFVVPVNGSITATVASFYGGTANLALIRDMNGNGNIDPADVVASSTAATGDAIRNKQVTAGTYFIRVSYGGGASAGEYFLSFGTDYAGSTLSTARNVGTLVGAMAFDDYAEQKFDSNSDNVDWYKIVLASPGVLNARMTGQQSGEDLDMQLIQDKNGNGNFDSGELLAVSSHPNSPNEFISKNLPAGTYYLRAYGVNGGTNYHLILSADRAGNNYSTANSVGALSGTKIFHDYVDSDDTDDFYKFTLSSSKSVKAVLSGLSANADLQLLKDNGNGVYDSGDIVASSSLSGTASDSITKTLSAGTYFIRVHRVSGGTNYALSLTA